MTEAKWLFLCLVLLSCTDPTAGRLVPFDQHISLVIKGTQTQAKPEGRLSKSVLQEIPTGKLFSPQGAAGRNHMFTSPKLSTTGSLGVQV